MHPVKERILRYEAKYGFNLEARRAFNRAIRGGVNPFKWIKGWFHRSKKTRSKKTQQPRQTSFTPYTTQTQQPRQTSQSPPIQQTKGLHKRKATSLSRPPHDVIDLTKHTTSTLTPQATKKTTTTIDFTQSKRLRSKHYKWYTGYCNKAETIHEMPHATLSQQIAFAQKLELLDYIFEEHDHGGRGDCCLYAWMGSSKEQYGISYDERLQQIFQTCQSNGMNIESDKSKMICLRRVASQIIEDKLTEKRKLQNETLTDDERDIIRRIKTPTIWLQDADISKIAEYMNLRFFIFVEGTSRWREYGPARYDPNTTNVPTYYLINKGGEQDGFLGNHFRSLTKKCEGHFSCE